MTTGAGVTDLTGTTAADDRAPGVRSPRPERARRRSPARTAVVLLVVAGMLLTAWALVAASQRAQVVVWFDAQAVTCREGVVAVEPLHPERDTVDAEFVHVVEASPEVDCSLRVHVENRGWRPVTLHGLEVPMHGARSRNGLRAGELSPLGAVPEPSDEHGLPPVDARYRFEHRLDPATRLTVSIALEHQPDGCLDVGSSSWLRDGPSLEVSALGRRGPRAPEGIAYLQRGTGAGSCGD